MAKLTNYIGERKALVFPVMCDGYLQIDYSQEIAQENHGIFGHDDSLTFEAIITPYDLNGLGYKFADTNNPASESGVTNSVKTFPALQTFNVTPGNYQSHLYRDQTARISDKMVIFHNDSFEVYLQNTTLTNQNQPAEYKMGMKVQIGTVTDTLLSNEVFTSATTQAISSSSATYTGLDDTTFITTAAANVITHLPGTDNFEMSGANDADNYFYIGQELFYLVGGQFVSIGQVILVDTVGKTVTMNAPVPFDLTGAIMYTHSNKEAPYLLTSAHIAATYDVTNGNMSLYYNGELVGKAVHSNFTNGNFSIEPDDCYIAQDPNIGSTTQFFGELHELAMLSEVKTEFNTLYTLAPNYRNILLYYQFEEVDL